MNKPSQWVLNVLKNVEAGNELIDIACGKGRHVFALKDRFNITAVDYDKKALSILSKIDNIKTIYQDLESKEEWVFSSNKYKIVLVTNYLYREKLNNLFDLVDEGGFIVYETFSDGNQKYGKPSNPNFLLKMDELMDRKPKNFKTIDYFCGKVEVPKISIIQRLAAKKIDLKK